MIRHILCCAAFSHFARGSPGGWPVSQTHPRTTQCGARCAVSRVPHAQYKWATAAASAAVEEGGGSRQLPTLPQKSREGGREMKQWLINERRGREGGRERKKALSLSHIDGRLGECGFLLIFAIIHVNPLLCGYFDQFDHRLGKIWA